MPDDEWKFDMLRNLWGGAENDPDKDAGQPDRKKSGGSRPWPTIDLHRFDRLTVQISEAEKAIDQAILQGCNGIIIIHGKGEDILRRQLLFELRSHQQVAEVNAVNDGTGNSGALRVRFR